MFDAIERNDAPLTESHLTNYSNSTLNQKAFQDVEKIEGKYGLMNIGKAE